MVLCNTGLSHTAEASDSPIAFNLTSRQTTLIDKLVITALWAFADQHWQPLTLFGGDPDKLTLLAGLMRMKVGD